MFDRLFSKPVDDSVLIEQAKENREAFAKLYDRFSSMVYRFARQRVATDQDAEDIVSETFMALAANISTYDATKSKKCTTRILSIAHNKITDYLR
jgi:RNA polymerase sigma factor (sigma-70 family)